MRILVVGSVIAAALIVAGGSAEAKIKCNKPSNCTDPAVVADARGGIEVACPCAGAANRKSYKSCTKTALRLAKTRPARIL